MPMISHWQVKARAWKTKNSLTPKRISSLAELTVASLDTLLEKCLESVLSLEEKKEKKMSKETKSLKLKRKVTFFELVH